MSALRLRNLIVWFGFHRVDEVGELDRILDEEDRNVVPHHVPHAFIRVKLDGESAHIARGIGRTAAAGDRAESQEQRRAFARLLKQSRFGEFRNRIRALEKPMCRRTSSVHHPFRDALVIEVLHLLAVVEILQQCRSASASFQRILVVADDKSLIARHRLAGRDGVFLEI